MRNFGNESYDNGNADGEFDAAINPRSFNVVDAANTVAAANVTLPDGFLDSQTNDAPLTDAASDPPPLPPSIANWLPTFRPFASSLSAFDEDADTSAPNNPSSSVKVAPPPDVDPAAHSYSTPIAHVDFSSSTSAPDVTSAQQANQNSLQKLYDHLSALDLDPSDHNHPVDAGEPTHTPVVVSDDNGAHTTGQIVASGGGHSFAGGTSTTTSSTTTTVGGSQTSGLFINVSYDASVNNAPASFKTDVAAAISFLESKFTDPITINIDVGYGEVDGQTMGSGAIGQSMYFVNTYNYSQLKTALAADAQTASDLSSVATLPSTDPTNGGTFFVSSANAKALGLTSGSSTDGFVGFSSSISFDYNNSDGVSAGTYDFYSVVLHEVTEVLGRETSDGQSGTYSPLDLFHYSAPGVRTFSGTTTGYFSVNNGQTNLNNFNTNSGGDFGDWAGNTIDAANAFGTAGAVAPFSSADLTAMDVIGWNVASGLPAAPVIGAYSPDTGVVNDGITSASVLKLAGTAPTGSSVSVYDGSSLLGSATVNTSGAWTFTTGTLGNGLHNFTATDTVSGLTSAVSAAFNVTVDTVRPAAPIVTNDTLLSTNQLVINGTALDQGAAESGDVVGIYDGGTLFATTTTNSSGAWNLTSAALGIGTHNFTTTVTDIAGNTSLASSAIAVTVNAAPTTIEANGLSSLVEVGTKFFLDSISTGSGPSLKYAGADVVAGQFGGGWAPVGTEQMTTGYEVAWKNAAGQYSIWTTDSSGNYLSTTAAMSASSTALESFEASFHQDLNGDGMIGVPGTPIEAIGSTSLVEVGTDFFLDSISAGSGPSLKYGGADVVAGQFGGGWVPIGTEQTATGYEVAWKNAAGAYSVWNTDSNGNYLSTTAALSASSTALESSENSFHQDLNGDGVIGVPGTVIEAMGSTSLVEVGTKFFLDSISTGSGPSLKYAGADVVASQFGDGWAPIGTEQTATGYEVAWKNAAGAYSVWNTDSNGNYLSTTAALLASSAALESSENSFHQDLNSDGTIGVLGTVIEATGSTSLVEVGTKFFLDSISTGSGLSLKYAGADVVAGQFGGGWAPIGTEQTATGYEVAWKNAAGAYSVWNTDSNGNYLSTTVALSASSTALETSENSFHQDLNSDGVIGVPSGQASAGALTTSMNNIQNSGGIHPSVANFLAPDTFKFIDLDLNHAPNMVMSSPASTVSQHGVASSLESTITNDHHAIETTFHSSNVPFTAPDDHTVTPTINIPYLFHESHG